MSSFADLLPGFIEELEEGIRRADDKSERLGYSVQKVKILYEDAEEIVRAYRADELQRLTALGLSIAQQSMARTQQFQTTEEGGDFSK